MEAISCHGSWKCCVCHCLLLVRTGETMLLKSFWWHLRQFPAGLPPHQLWHVQRTFWLYLALSPTTELLVTLLVLPDVDTHLHHQQNALKLFPAYKKNPLFHAAPPLAIALSPSPDSQTSVLLHLPCTAEPVELGLHSSKPSRAVLESLPT